MPKSVPAHLDEALMGAAVLRDVGVRPQHQFAVGPLDGILRRARLHAQQPVCVAAISLQEPQRC